MSYPSQDAGEVMPKVDLKELVEQMDFMLDEWSYFIKKSTGGIISMEDRYLYIAENPDEPSIFKISDWEREEISKAEVFGIDEEWYPYKKAALTGFAKKWCAENDLEYQTEDKQ